MITFSQGFETSLQFCSYGFKGETIKGKTIDLKKKVMMEPFRVKYDAR